MVVLKVIMQGNATTKNQTATQQHKFYPRVGFKVGAQKRE